MGLRAGEPFAVVAPGSNRAEARWRQVEDPGGRGGDSLVEHNVQMDSRNADREHLYHICLLLRHMSFY